MLLELGIGNDFSTQQVFELGTVLRLSRPAGIGVYINTVINSRHLQERLPTMIDRQRPGIAFGLSAYLDLRLRSNARAGLSRTALEVAAV